ncbi:unnamed protein product [Parnassius apollo]|uniref:(apollo) hypothetical protein n=1 Tax=Parnassius apollo TaxID=110799 RepID=A0A8S3YDT3_PARAO|nr:unnamed protein product [Parnassius apollo]
MQSLRCRGALALNKKWTKIYIIDPDRGYQEDKIDEVSEKDLRLEGILLKLPHSIHNISTKLTQSNSFIISNNNTFAVAGVSLAKDKQLAVTVTRSCWGLWDTSTGRLLAQLADAPLGAIVTHAVITPAGDSVITAESGNVVIWDIAEKQIVFKEEQKGVKQVLLLEDGTKFITISMQVPIDNNDNLAVAIIVARTIPDGEKIYTADYELRGTGYRAAVVSADEHHVEAPGVDKSSRDCLHVFHARTGARLHRIPVKNSGIKDMQSIVALPHKPHWVAVVGNDKAGILDIKTKRHVRFVNSLFISIPPKRDKECKPTIKIEITEYFYIM